ncbi:MAG: hypothetical protein ACKVT2_20740 [Saprospiraceae bacterium]
MKHLFLFFMLLSALGLNAQHKAANLSSSNFFNPASDPIALRFDTTFQLLVSEYVLAKSVKARLGQGCQVLKIYKSRFGDGNPSLLIEGVFQDKNRQPFLLSVPLLADAHAQFYFASDQAIVCAAPGCNNCSIMNGVCVGCCDSASGTAVALPTPLSKIQMTIDE